MTQRIILSTFVLLLGLGLGSAHADQIYVHIQGQKQGELGGWYNPGEIDEVSTNNFGLVEDLAWSIVSPRDAASGLPTGKRQHKPVTLRVRMSGGALLVGNALTENENLTLVKLDWFARDNLGVFAKLRTMTLTNASVGGLSVYSVREQDELVTYTDVSLTYQKVGIEDYVTSYSYEDDWETPVR